MTIPQRFSVSKHFHFGFLKLILAVMAVVLSGGFCPILAQNINVYITPGTATLPSSLAQQFTAEVTGTDNTAVTWSTTSGEVSSSGLFTAPSVKKDTTVTVTATSVADPSDFAEATVTVTPAISVSISPTSVSMNADRQQLFQATVTNTDETRVTWTATAGTISGGGMFTSPSVTQNKTVQIRATSVEDPTKSATANVTVMPPLAVVITPSTATVQSGATQQLTGTVENATNPAATWTATLGTVSSSGLFTAPTVYEQTNATVTVTSVEDPNQQARAKVTITPPTAPPFAITTTALPIGPVNSSYSFNLKATGGFPPYQWTLDSGTLPTGLSLSATGVLSGKPTQIGIFPVTLRATDLGNQRVHQSMDLTIGGSAVGQEIAVTFFGLHLDYANVPWPNISFGTQRFWDSGTAWAQINTSSGYFDWSTTDTRVAQALANKVDILFDLARTPDWAQCPSTDTKCGTGAGNNVCSNFDEGGQGNGPNQCYPPSDLNVDGTGTDQNWINWVTALATRYNGEIKYYEIWNEPDAPSMWQGTTAQLVRMTQDARCIIIGTGCSPLSTYTQTAIDPSAQITTPAYVSDTGINVQTAMSQFLSAGGGQYVDVLAYHGYVQWPDPPEGAITEAAGLQNTLAAYSQQSKPLFSTEGGFGAKVVIDDPDQEAAWVARFELLMQSINVGRSYWYAWDGAATSLWSSTTGTEIGGTTYGEMVKWMVGATLSSPCVAVGTVWQCGYTRPGGYNAIAVWDSSQTCDMSVCTYSTFKLPPGGYTNYLTIAGIETTITGSTVQIGSQPILLQNKERN